LADKKRTVQGGYEIIHAVELGGSELILAEKKGDPEVPYMVSDCVWNKDFCYESHHNAMGSTDFLEIMKLFAARLAERVVSIETERDTRGIPFQTLTADDCYPVGKTDLKGCVVVIKPDKLAPEYQTIDYQLALCTGGFGANPDSNGRTVFCKNLITGETARYNRTDLAGTVSEERLPDWAKVNLDALRPAVVKETAAEPLGKEQFWQMIETAREKAGSWQGMREPLLEAIAQLEEPDIIRWQLIFDEYHDLAYKDKIWAAATLINGGCSDDGFIDFRAWLIAQGKEVYMNALADPDSLAELETIKALGIENQTLEFTPPNGYQNEAYFESFSSVAGYAYKNKMGRDADIYDVTENNPLSGQEKADIVGEIKYAADIDSRQWRGGDSWLDLLEKMSDFLPKLHKIFSGDEIPEVSADITPPYTSKSRAPAEKESVLEKIRQDRQGKKTTETKPKNKKQNKGDPEL